VLKTKDASAQKSAKREQEAEKEAGKYWKQSKRGRKKEPGPCLPRQVNLRQAGACGGQKSKRAKEQKNRRARTWRFEVGGSGAPKFASRSFLGLDLLFLLLVLSLRSFAHAHPLFSTLSIYIAKKRRGQLKRANEEGHHNKYYNRDTNKAVIAQRSSEAIG
jgi:hypothetical protein